MTYRSAGEDLALHGLRVLGFATPGRVANRYRLDADDTEEWLLDFQARGWVDHLSFGDSAGWSLTDAGRAENERRLAAELDRAGAKPTVERVDTAFQPLNARFNQACTDWQIRPTRADPLASNDHTDWRWDDRVLRTLEGVEAELRALTDQLTAVLQRFERYADLYAAARRKVDAGQRAWVDASDRDSCHLVWMQLHEDLLATLGRQRGR